MLDVYTRCVEKTKTVRICTSNSDDNGVLTVITPSIIFSPIVAMCGISVDDDDNNVND